MSLPESKNSKQNKQKDGGGRKIPPQKKIFTPDAFVILAEIR